MKTSIISLLIIFGSSILIAAPARSNIVNISKNGEPGYYIDVNTINLDRSFTRADVSTTLKGPTKLNGRFYSILSVTTKWGVKCSDRSMAIMGKSYYSQNGKYLGSNPKSSKWNAINPGSTEENIYNFLCNTYKR